ncbi:Uncharacterised protein [Lacrimispora sphenoides]|uniref:Uncharacterized protein n=1 Tax=Lacrimispora sphenoides JCM 1415 TaxID=1297793 RepID=A0ABY1CHX1_9FIRM|nr:hypothetical protein SAMN02745906_4445 [[Clostridium] sphenoides JCM 1415]SUY49018.1 Uncharacterised protein [Lacrimispora sphenoides]
MFERELVRFLADFRSFLMKECYKEVTGYKIKVKLFII